MKRIAAVLSSLLAVQPALAALKSRSVEYKDGDVVLQGTAYYDDGFKDKRPGVVVVHEWTGLGSYARRRAEMLAKQGYTALAIDMYGKGVYAKDHDEAGRLAGAFFGDRELMRRRALAGLDQLRKLPFVDESRLAAIGYCFGGAAVLELARAGAELKGVASFHGQLASPSPAAAKPKAKILVLHGSEDAHVNPHIPAFLEEMRKSGADWQMINYGGAVHGFTNWENASAYDKSADERSWKALLAFFEEIFR